MPLSSSQEPDQTVTQEYFDKFKVFPSTLLKLAANMGLAEAFYADLRTAINRNEPIADSNAYAEKLFALSRQDREAA